MTDQHTLFPEFTDIKSCVPVPLQDIGDILRMIIANNPRERGGYIFHVEHEGKHLYGVFNLIMNYYNMRGLPLFFYCLTDKEPTGNFIAYQPVAAENWKFVDGVQDDPKWLTVPLIKFKHLPLMFTVEQGDN